MKYLFATSNGHKFELGKYFLKDYGIALQQHSIDIDETQSENAKQIICDKAHKVYNIVGKPVIVSDDSWDIPAFGGFPGPYMKSLNHWFTAQDFLDFMHCKTNRRIILHQYLCYADGIKTKVFSSQIYGTIGYEVLGNYGDPMMKVVMLDIDNGLTLSQTYDLGAQHKPARFAHDTSNSWHLLAAWLQKGLTTK